MLDILFSSDLRHFPNDLPRSGQSLSKAWMDEVRAKRSILPTGLGSPKEPICLLSGISQYRLSQQLALPGLHSSRGHSTDLCLSPARGQEGLKVLKPSAPGLCIKPSGCFSTSDSGPSSDNQLSALLVRPSSICLEDQGPSASLIVKT